VLRALDSLGPSGGENRPSYLRDFWDAWQNGTSGPVARMMKRIRVLLGQIRRDSGKYRHFVYGSILFEVWHAKMSPKCRLSMRRQTTTGQS
jgi:hypothetical protein